MTFVGTRPELIKLSVVIKELDQYFDHQLVHTGQNYDFELNEIFFNELEIRKPDFFLNAAGSTAIETIANVLTAGDRILEKEKPEAILVYGDTNSCLVCIAAKKRKIPIFHMEAGNRSFDQRVPEEVNRKIIDHLSDINMTLTEQSRRYLLDEGLQGNRVIKVGSCMKEVLEKFKANIEDSNILSRLNLTPQSYFVVSAHREENVDNPETLKELLRSLEQLNRKYNKPVVFSVHPRTKKNISAFKHEQPMNGVIFSKPLGFFDYVQLQKNAFCVLSDSGTITEESALLGFPAVMIRESHERPEGSDAGTLMFTHISEKHILDAVKIITSQKFDSKLHRINDYEISEVSKTVVRIIASHIDFINREVWHR